MIEKLMDSETRYGEPESSQIGTKIRETKQALLMQLNQDGIKLLDDLSDAYLHQSSVQIDDAFACGFCTAVDLMLDVILHSRG